MSNSPSRRLRAPTDDGAALVVPRLTDLDQIVAQNRASFRSYGLHRNGVLAHAAFAREELYGLACRYTGQYRSVAPIPEAVGDDKPFFLAGHQPELFHPGVWFKNFLLSHAASRADAIPINLIIDNDVFRNTSIGVPTRDGTARVPFDRSGVDLPIEERPIIDPSCLLTFADRVTTHWADTFSGADRLILVDHWKNVARFALSYRQQSPELLLGQLLARARHLLEEQWGLQSLELPLSAVCQTGHFRWFTTYLLADAQRFGDVYNSSLAEYRAINHVRSHSHPVPALARDAEWMEAPFWIWTKANPTRRRLFVRFQANTLELTDRSGLVIKLTDDREVEQLGSAQDEGIKIRPRALITTMYARLVLSDLFIHGIGGAKYDELTDLIIRRYFGIEPPAFVTATATFRLPIDRPNVSAGDVQASARRIRELRYRPEFFVRDPLVSRDADLTTKLAALASEKRQFLDQHDLRRCSTDVFDQLNLLNLAMNDLLSPVDEELRAEHARLVTQLNQSRLLGSREFSFVLFPSEILPARLLDLCKLSS